MGARALVLRDGRAEDLDGPGALRARERRPSAAFEDERDRGLATPADGETRERCGRGDRGELHDASSTDSGAPWGPGTVVTSNVENDPPPRLWARRALAARAPASVIS